MCTYIIPFLLQRKRITRLILAFFTIFLTSYPIYTQSEKGHVLKTVVIDAGHGGKDFGAIGKKGREKDIVLNIALKVGKYIEENIPEVKVIYTRKTDVFIPLHERAEIANKNNADLFISIHVNSNPSTKPYGFETYTMGLHKSADNLQVAQLENSAILYEENYNETYEGFDPKSAESYIIFSLLQNSFMEQSIEYASIIQQEFKNNSQIHDRGVKQAGFLVLWKTAMPSVLIEAGFLSNLKDEKYLLTDEGQTEIALAIFKAFKNYKISYDEINKINIKTAQNITNASINAPVLSQEIVFKVQILSSSKQVPLNSDVFLKLKDVQEFYIEGIYKYACGAEKSFNDIIKLKDEISIQFPDAFVIAVKNEKVIPLNEALKEINR